MYARRVADKTLSFDFTEGLLRDNLLIVDRETKSVWSQLERRAVAGPLKGTELAVIPATQATWKFWRERHPDTEVRIYPSTQGHPYYYRRNLFWALLPGGHDPSALGLGLSFDGDALFVPLSELRERSGPQRVTVGGRKLTVHFDAEGITAWAEDEHGRLVEGMLVYEKSWKAFQPATRRWPSR